MRTRSTNPASTKAEESDRPIAPAVVSSATPSKTIILPSEINDDARFVCLENPKTGIPTRYLFCPNLGLHEFTAIASSSSAPKSILCQTAPNNHGEIEDSNDAHAEDEYSKSTSKSTSESGSITQTAHILIATPIDVLFFLLPILIPPGGQTSASRLFQPLDDILDAREDLPRTLKDIILHDVFRDKVEARMKSVCDSVDTEGEKMFRLSEDKLIKELVSKAERMTKSGLPPSLEERFVRRALELPVLSVKREDIPTTGTAESESTANSQNQADSQSSATPSTTDTSSTPVAPSTPATECPPNETNSSNEITLLLRIRTALSFIQSSYLPLQVSTIVEEKLKSAESPRDFTPLTEHVKYIAKLHAEAQASRSLSDFSRKRTTDDYEAAEERAEKKRKKEEEEKKKKAGESRGVRELKKADTTGMKKLSAFFGKATANNKKNS